MRRDIREELTRRVLVLDGAMGTMIQRLGLGEEEFRGERFASHQVRLQGCNDLLCLTRPQAIADIHREYIAAGADIIETNTFNANAISLKDYGLGRLAREISRRGAEIAREAAGNDIYVAGSMGPTGVSLSMGGGDYDELAGAYRDQAAGLIEGGVDLLMIETAFDTLNAKAAICGITMAMEEAGRSLPVMVSATLTENGRLLSGQTLEAFVISVSHARPLSIGLNCGFGADGMIPYLRRLQGEAAFVSVHPNAGLPDELGRYVETPEAMADVIGRILDERLVNIVGGCCGTTPAHIRAIAAAASGALPRVPAAPTDDFRLSGLEPMVSAHGGFMKVGERCNVAGSRKFLRLIEDGNTDEALDIAASQVAAGASVLDINMDDAMLDAPSRMAEFVAALGLDTRTAPVPLMIDSSDFSVIERALKLIQGRPIVNSISLKEGEDAFLAHARSIRRLGAAVVVMAFDEQGQADTYDRRIEICRRSYDLLTRKAGFRGDEIVFDPNVLAVATGIDSHADYGRDFLRATGWITRNLPGARVSGGVSNLSFSFRGNNPLRKAMHALFIARGRDAGLEMAIVNPSAPIAPTPDMPADLLEAIDDVILNRRPDATARLVEMATLMKQQAGNGATRPAAAPSGASASAPTLGRRIISGSTEDMIPLIDAELRRLGSPMKVIDITLMEAMNTVGDLFAAGRLFLPQVVRSAAAMRKAVDYLTPMIESAAETDGAESRGRKVIVLATVKGDVHDIGKNIVGVVMRCAGFRVVDLGVMVPPEEIVRAAIEHDACCIGLSGLITPSLGEMCVVARMLEEAGMKIPLFVGGATTSALHTAVKIAPLYSAPVARTAEAASLPALAGSIDRREVRERIAAEQAELRERYARRESLLPLARARECSEAVDTPSPAPMHMGAFRYSPSVAELLPLVSWRAFMGEWRMDPSAADAAGEAARLKADALAELERMDVTVNALAVIARARRTGPETITITDCDGALTGLHTPRTRLPNPVTGKCPAIADYVAATEDHIGLFAVCVTPKADAEGDADEYRSLLRQTVCHRLAEACSRLLHSRVKTELWGLPDSSDVRPAVGYSCLPDHKAIFELDRILHLDTLGITLTENGAMNPGSSTCGLILGHPAARYFEVVNQ